MREITNWQRVCNLFREKGSGGTKDEGKFLLKEDIKLSRNKYIL